MQHLLKASKDPKILSEAMEMLYMYTHIHIHILVSLLVSYHMFVFITISILLRNTEMFNADFYICIGMQNLMKASKDPKMLAEAMEMLKDPETAAEVYLYI
jgi:hypothetical protein